MEYGIFNDEGCIVCGYWSRAEAEAAVAKDYTAEDEVHVAAICPDHEEQEHKNCEVCDAGDDAEDAP